MKTSYICIKYKYLNIEKYKNLQISIFPHDHCLNIERFQMHHIIDYFVNKIT